MNRRFFYLKFSLSSIKKNGQFYFPYFVTCVMTIAMYYMISFIAYDEGLKQMPGADSLIMLLNLGQRLIAVFGGVFLFYTNSFLVKRRKVELGLYNILGMEKKHITKVMMAETLLLAVSSIAAGVLSGIIFSKLVMMCLIKMLKFSVPVVFSISPKAVLYTILLFGIVFLIILLANIFSVIKAKPVELIGSKSAGEKEPKSNFILTLVGVFVLGYGYYMALSIVSPMEAITKFFQACLWVILGTYILFTAGSITLLKLLRKNKKYYYQTNHFISVSGMMYRMKQNAAGLSNICILCTMVLITISTTLCMYLGVEDALRNRFPNDIAVSAEYTLNQRPNTKEMESVVKSTLKEQGIPLEKIESYDSLYMAAEYVDGMFLGRDVVEIVNEGEKLTKFHEFCFYTQQDYEKFTGKALNLSRGQAALYEKGEELGDKFFIFNEEYEVAERLDSFFLADSSMEGSFSPNLHLVVLSDSEALEQVLNGIIANSDKEQTIDYRMGIDISASGEETLLSYQKLHETLAPYDGGSLSWECREGSRQSFLADFGGFLFIGIFFGILFLMMTVLIIYYKQISEGYDDRERFLIMQKVGMSRLEVRRTIKSQILMVFMLPIVVAVFHIIVAFPMMRQLLEMFQLTNLPLFIGCTIGTVFVFTLVYIAVYLVTSKTYYKILL